MALYRARVARIPDEAPPRVQLLQRAAHAEMDRGVQWGGRRPIADGMPGAAHRQVMVARPSPWNLGGLSVRELARRVWSEIETDEVMDRAASLAYYLVFA